MSSYLGLVSFKIASITVVLKGAASVMLAVAVCLPTMAMAQDYTQVQKSKPLTLAEQGSFYVGGNTQFVEQKYTGAAVGRAGEAMINQMYVQFQKPAKGNGQYPIVFVHGCCLSSKTWETTPDGRMGWNEYFTRKGFDTYMADQVGRARSGFDALQYAKVRAQDAPPDSSPAHFIATDAFAWNIFRFGNFATKTPWPDERFPMKTVGVGPDSNLTFYKQVIPDMTSTLTASMPGCTTVNCAPVSPNGFWHTPAAMAQLASDLGGAILVGHSQSSTFPTRAALQPGATGIKGIIQLETGCYDTLTPSDIAVLKNIPILIVEGDHYVSPDGTTPVQKPPAACAKEMDQLKAAGGNMTYIHLPAMGIKGNSHMFMQDNNNLQIADIIINWIDKNVKPGKQRLSGIDKHK